LIICVVPDMANISSAAAMSSAAARLLLQTTHSPLISPLNVNMLIERELMKTGKSTSDVTAGADSILCHDQLTYDRLANSTMSSKCLTDKHCHQAVPLQDREVGNVGSDNCERKPSVKSSVDSRLQKLQNIDSGTLCFARESDRGELQFHCKSDLVADVKKSDGLTGSGLFLCSPAEMTSSVLPVDELPHRPSAIVAGLSQNDLLAKEINNNCRRSYTRMVRKAKIKVDCNAAVRKSERCNRGRRYHELMSQGVLQHHLSRKRCESLSV